MKSFKHGQQYGLFVCVCAGFILVCPPKVSAGDPPLQVTKDGLVLKSQTDQRLVYVRPGANFSKYDRVALLDCLVEFQKDWQQNYNANVVDPSKEVTDQDVQRMKAIVQSAGSATLYLELWDSVSRTLLAKVVDAQAAQQPFAQQANSVTNAAAADFVLKNWADDLVRHLDAARKTPNG